MRSAIMLNKDYVNQEMKKWNCKKIICRNETKKNSKCVHKFVLFILFIDWDKQIKGGIEEEIRISIIKYPNAKHVKLKICQNP